MTDTDDKASTKEIFNVLLAAQINFHSNFIANSFKLAAVLTVVMGWLISSTTAQEFLKNVYWSIWILFLAFTIFSTAISYLNFVKAKSISKNTHNKMLNLDYMDSSYFENYVVSKRLYLSMLLLVMVLHGTVIVAFVYIKFSPDSNNMKDIHTSNITLHRTYRHRA